MLKRVTVTVGLVIGGIIVVSMFNPFMAYHVSRYSPVQFGDYYEYSGVVDLRTAYSDGAASYERVGTICDSMGLHFAIVTDRNTVEPFKDGWTKRWGMTLMIPAVELRPDQGDLRYIVLGDSVPLLPGHGVTLDSSLERAKRQGSMVVLKPGHEMPSEAAQSGPFVGGIEIYNFSDSWRGMFDLLNINKLFGAYIGFSIDPRVLNYLIKFPEKRVNEFDAMNKTSRVVALSGLGATGSGKGEEDDVGKFLTYESQFNLLHTVIVSAVPYNAQYNHDREITLDAIRRGHSYTAFSGLESARGFIFTATSGGRVALMGDSLLLRGSGDINIVLPDSNDVETELIRNGRIVGEFKKLGTIRTSLTEPGVYRVQVFQKRAMLPFFLNRLYPWILSNPIYVFANQNK